MIVDGEVDPEIELPDPSLGFTPKPIEMTRTPKPGATRTGGYYVAPGRADAGGRALGAQQRAEREKKEKASAEKAKNDADLAAEDAELDASGMVDEKGRPIRENIVAMHRAGPDGELGTDDDGPNLDSRTVAEVKFSPGSGYRNRKPGSARRIGATPDELALGDPNRSLPNESGNRPPVLPGKGFAVDRGGPTSMRAPQLGVMEGIDGETLPSGAPITSTPPTDQRDFFAWQNAMKQVAVAAGFDFSQYETEQSLINDAVKVLKKHEQNKKAGWVPTLSESGEPIYTPNADAKKRSEDSRRRASARQFVDQHKPDEQTGLAIMKAADEGKWDQVDRLVRGARNERRAGTAQAAMDQARLRGQTQQMNNPNINRAMWHNSVMKQPNAAGVAQVGAAWEKPGSIPAMTAAEAVEAESANREADRKSEERKAEIIAGAKKEPDGLTAYQQQIRGVLNSAPDVISAINQIRTINTAASLSDRPLIEPKNVEYQTHAEVSRHEIRSGKGPDNIATQTGLKMLGDQLLGPIKTDAEKDTFVRRAMADLGVTEEYARAWIERGGR